MVCRCAFCGLDSHNCYSQLAFLCNPPHRSKSLKPPCLTGSAIWSAGAPEMNRQLYKVLRTKGLFTNQGRVHVCVRTPTTPDPEFFNASGYCRCQLLPRQACRIWPPAWPSVRANRRSQKGTDCASRGRKHDEMRVQCVHERPSRQIMFRSARFAGQHLVVPINGDSRSMAGTPHWKRKPCQPKPDRRK